MSRILVVFSAVALAALAGCGSDPVTPAPAPVVVTPAPAASPPVVVATPAVRPGFGRVESITALPASSSAAAGGTPLRRLGVKMEDGTVQFVDTAAGNIAMGDRVELTSDGKIRH